MTLCIINFTTKREKRRKERGEKILKCNKRYGRKK